MTITREQVADLQPGDVVELSDSRWGGVVICGPVRVTDIGPCVGPLLIGLADGTVPFDPDGPIVRNLLVKSRAPRPLYVNHDRTEPVSGDVVRVTKVTDDDSTTWTYAPRNCVDDGGAPWIAVTSKGELVSLRFRLDPGGLRLLVDGETGQVVP